ncbi:hypothetical protein AVEN_130716-1 [Araneus ventricosus]|uniref:Uncharacterized protein n=1 Tax=Araneus ventricosus TaxID=182803 RepID=A0A4Y2FDG5_ARAVE|nr:hypothetical protein AVEN_130716-1 [Araneus ventricosus]
MRVEYRPQYLSNDSTSDSNTQEGRKDQVLWQEGRKGFGNWTASVHDLRRAGRRPSGPCARQSNARVSRFRKADGAREG